MIHLRTKCTLKDCVLIHCLKQTDAASLGVCHVEANNKPLQLSSRLFVSQLPSLSTSTLLDFFPLSVSRRRGVLRDFLTGRVSLDQPA